MQTHPIQLHIPDRIGDPLDIKPEVDNSDLFDLSFETGSLPAICHSYAEGSLNSTRNITDGKSVQITVLPFSGLRELGNTRQNIIYHDVLLKGVGSLIPDYSGVFETQKIGRNIVSVQVPSLFEERGMHRILRYSTVRLETLTSLLGFSNAKNGQIDSHTSMYLEKNLGVRGRSLIALWKLPLSLQVSTNEGFVSIGEIQNRFVFEPSLTAWAMRCKYRVMDVRRFVEALVAYRDLGGVPRPFGHASLLSQNEKNGVRFKTSDPENYNLTEVDFQYARETFIDLAKSLLVRMSTDNEDDFFRISRKYETVDSSTLQGFYVDYLHVFSTILGREFGKLRHAVAKSTMFNTQNITLLSEIVDNDVTVINGSKFNASGNFVPYHNTYNTSEYSQFRGGWGAVTDLLRSLSIVKILDVSEDLHFDIRQNYVVAYLEYLKQYMTPSEFVVAKNILHEDATHDLLYEEKTSDDYLGKGSHRVLRDVVKNLV